MPLRLDQLGDLIRVNGAFARNDEISDKGAAIAQGIQVRLSRWLGEWVYGIDEGIDWPTLMAKGTDPRIINSTIRREILSMPGVQKVNRLSQSYNSATRTLSVSGEVSSEEGNIDFNAQVVGA